MRKTIFLANRWVKFALNGFTCIGISHLYCNADIDDPKSHLVHFISNERKTSIINFHDCVDLTYLQFLKKPAHVKELKIDNDVLNLEAQIDLLMCPSISRKTITVLAKNYSNQLFMN
jgi:hypothetical protein